jgi:hypothetical protein
MLRVDDDVVIWRKPLARLRQYQHALLFAAGKWTVEPEASMEDQLADLGL